MRRKRRYPQELFDRAVALAAQISVAHAARVCGLSRPTIHKELRERGQRTARRRYTPEQMAQAVRVAAATSQHNARRHTGISCDTIAKEMRRQGVATRRPGNFTREEALRLAGRMVGLA